MKLNVKQVETVDNNYSDNGRLTIYSYYYYTCESQRDTDNFLKLKL